MPYALADDWFEEMLNSVSISYQRQMMGKTKDVKKGAPTHSESSPQTRSASRLQREGTTEGAGTSGEAT